MYCEQNNVLRHSMLINVKLTHTTLSEDIQQ